MLPGSACAHAGASPNGTPPSTRRGCGFIARRVCDFVSARMERTMAAEKRMGRSRIPARGELAVWALAVAALVVLVACGITLAGSGDPLGSQDWAAWVQAIFSVVAIAATAVIASRAERRTEHEKREAAGAAVQARRAPVLLVETAFREMAALVVTNTDGGPAEAKFSDIGQWRVLRGRVDRSWRALMSLQLRDYATGDEFMVIGSAIELIEETMRHLPSETTPWATFEHRSQLLAAAVEIGGITGSLDRIAAGQRDGNFISFMDLV